MGENTDLLTIKKVVAIMNKYHLKYSKNFLLQYPTPINLRKTQVNHVIIGEKNEFEIDFIFEDYLINYCRKLTYTQLLIKQEVGYFLKYEFSSRVKQPQSRLSKLLTYRFEKKEIGKLPMNKCLNDLFGCRLILEYNDINELEKSLKEELKDEKNLKITKKCNEVYEAIHIYCMGLNKTYFPWEIQLWHKDVAERNKLSHAKHKQSYLKWPEIMLK
ncbi:hypothetical protein ACMGE6_04830 [Macrococcus equi]|uniref:hypothetical protein n=1 Tax=Macrococcus equi TaxID=3395462 RepID=UPI0039BDACF1